MSAADRQEDDYEEDRRILAQVQKDLAGVRFFLGEHPFGDIGVYVRQVSPGTFAVLQLEKELADRVERDAPEFPEEAVVMSIWSAGDQVLSVNFNDLTDFLQRFS